MKTVILVPCYNEAPTIEKVVCDFKRVMLHKQGKGNVVQSMFREIVADCYIMVDGDDTYPAESAVEIENLVLERGVDMVIGDRLSSTYFEENDRLFHNTGNKLVRKSINFFFKSNLNDIMTGMRGFSYNFVKSFPVSSKEFEIETEMSVFALMNNFKIEEIPIEYRDRIDGSESKLNTYKDGYKVVKTIYTLTRDKRPLFFFTSVTLLLLLIAAIQFFPILFNYFVNGTVLKIPSLIVISTVVIIAGLTFFTGVILHVLKKQHAENLRRHLILLNELKED